jgi:hypothetical protein
MVGCVSMFDDSAPVFLDTGAFVTLGALSNGET